MAQSCKRKVKASVSISSDGDICSPEGKKARNSPCLEPNISIVFSDNDQVLESLNMTEKNRYSTGTDLPNARRGRKQVTESRR